LCFGKTGNDTFPVQDTTHNTTTSRPVCSEEDGLNGPEVVNHLKIERSVGKVTQGSWCDIGFVVGERGGGTRPGRSSIIETHQLQAFVRYRGEREVIRGCRGRWTSDDDFDSRGVAQQRRDGSKLGDVCRVASVLASDGTIG
jgi:hypothetical protein